MSHPGSTPAQRLSVLVLIAIAMATLLAGCGSSEPRRAERDAAAVPDASHVDASAVIRDDAGPGTLDAAALDAAPLDASPRSDASTVSRRATFDLPDDEPGAYQLHVLYVEPQDRTAAPALDEDGTLAHAVASFDGWLASRTGGPRFRIDRHDGAIDVTYVKLGVTEAVLAQGIGMDPPGPRHIHERLAELLAPRFSDPHKLYVVYYDGLAIGTCGDSPLSSHTAMIYVGGVWSTTFLTADATAGRTTLPVYDTAQTNVPAAPFDAHLGAEAVRVVGVTTSGVTLAAPLAAAHLAGELLQPDVRPQDCRLNPFSRDGVEFTYATFVGIHEIAHALGIVAPDAPEHAPAPVAPGHLHSGSAAGTSDLMYQGNEAGRCGDYAATPERSPCQLDPAHRNYFQLPAGSPLVDLADSVFLTPSPTGAVLPPRW